jgi:hypothetical protein
MIQWDFVHRNLQRLKELSSEIELLVCRFADVEVLRGEGRLDEARQQTAYLDARLQKCRTDLDKSLTDILRSIGLENGER